VEVDPSTGCLRVTRGVVGHDGGLIISPAGLNNQIEGTVLQEIGRAAASPPTAPEPEIEDATMFGVPQRSGAIS
jgi:hypothetical protein